MVVRAIDDFTFQFELASPGPSFLKLLWQPFLAPPAVHRSRVAQWTGLSVDGTSSLCFERTFCFAGMETVPSHRRKGEGSGYWEADSVNIEELIFTTVQRHYQCQSVPGGRNAFHGSSPDSSTSCAGARTEERTWHSFGAADVLVPAQYSRRRPLTASPCVMR